MSANIAIQIHAQRNRQLARFVIGEFDCFERIPGHQIPVGERVEVNITTQQQTLLAQFDHFLACQVERGSGAEWARITGALINFAGEHRPVCRDDRQRRAERADVQVHATDALLRELGSLFAGNALHLPTDVIPPHRLAGGVALAAGQ